MSNLAQIFIALFSSGPAWIVKNSNVHKRTFYSDSFDSYDADVILDNMRYVRHIQQTPYSRDGAGLSGVFTHVFVPLQIFRWPRCEDV